VLDTVQAQGQVQFECVEAPFGGLAYQQTGEAFPDETRKVCDEADAILKGPIGLSKEESDLIPLEEQPERGGNEAGQRYVLSSISAAATAR
jgi:3-isopropylmalate dehydrogenase